MNQGHRNDSDIRAFFDSWHVYSQIIRHDYMAHRGIHVALRESLASRKSPFSVMDLGCGDGSVIAETLRGLPVQAYVGVDLSVIALAEARKSFADALFRLSLVESNLSDYLTNPAPGKVDVVIAGFAVHHLTNDEKPKFFSDCFDKLSTGGDLYLYDVFCRHGESRELFHESYCRHIETGWTELTVEERRSVIEHARVNDFPVSFETLSTFARQAGFRTARGPEYSDAGGFHCLCRFRMKGRDPESIIQQGRQ